MKLNGATLNGEEAEKKTTRLLNVFVSFGWSFGCFVSVVLHCSHNIISKCMAVEIRDARVWHGKPYGKRCSHRTSRCLSLQQKTMRRKIRTRIAEKSRKLIGEILFMANSKCERIYNLVGCVALTTHLSIWWANRFERQRKTDCKWTHINFGTGFTVIMKLPGHSHHQINTISLSSRLSAKINYNDDKVSRKLSAGVFRMQCEKNIS